MKVTACRVCGASSLFEVMDFGRMALANAYLPDAAAVAEEAMFPMALCLCEQCGYVQIDEEVAPEVLFRNYLYVTGVSEAVQQHGRLIFRLVSELAGLPKASPIILEAASNDGTMLSIFQREGWRVVGVDPAENVAKIANARGIETVPDFFDRRSALQLVQRLEGRVDVFLARHVIAHVADLHEFVEGIRVVLAAAGVAIIECSHILPFFLGVQYDQVYHEHLGYFSVTVLTRLLEMHGLDLFAVQEVGMHGGSLLAFAQTAGGKRPRQESVDRVLQTEREAGVACRQSWAEFARRAHEQKSALVAELRTLKQEGKRIAAYGAAAKGQVMLQFCGIGRDLIDFVVDMSDLKQGRLTPGTHIPILAPGELLKRRPDVVLLCSWNYAEEILRQQKAYLEQGGRFLHPLPLPHYL